MNKRARRPKKNESRKLYTQKPNNKQQELIRSTKEMRSKKKNKTNKKF